MDVALLVHTKNEWSRKVLMGVAQYGDDQGGWNFLIPPAIETGELRLPKGWDGDGIICRLNSEQLKKEVLESNTPCVNVSWLSQHQQEIPRVASCERSCSELAVEFLLEKQFENFGYVGFNPSLTYSSVIESTIAPTLAS